uniref:Uncharacterized protein n=1 Tax=Kwoniella bestiolae CBS 10118 TaxID=1296100 RepID=A0A1B9G806_9TREE|nr:hypothetical protein I302_02002 [Kwoniella bestiolae CBS 10118]OCF27165.1 hypothetical protein I302_02002 [Kwoniella bestiolae CBS 10118]
MTETLAMPPPPVLADAPHIAQCGSLHFDCDATFPFTPSSSPNSTRALGPLDSNIKSSLSPRGSTLDHTEPNHVPSSSISAIPHTLAQVVSDININININITVHNTRQSVSIYPASSPRPYRSTVVLDYPLPTSFNLSIPSANLTPSFIHHHLNDPSSPSSIPHPPDRSQPLNHPLSTL